MIAKDLISADLWPLKTDDTVAGALQFLQDWNADVLPVTDQGILKGYVTEDFLLEHNDRDTLSDVLPFLPFLPRLFAEQHLFDCLRLMHNYQYSALAVEDSDGKILGITTQKELLKALGHTLMISQAGAIVVMEIQPQDYSLSELSRIIEYNDAKILGLALTEKTNSNVLEVHVKLNISNLKNILATLERYNYRVIQYFSREDLTEDLEDRYKSFMKYLDI